MDSALTTLLGVAVDHHGFITPATAAAAGVEPGRLPVMHARGQLDRRARGLYRIPQLPSGRYDDLAAAVLQVGHSAVVSHASSLYLHGLSDIAPPAIDVTVPTSARVRRAGLEGIRVWRNDLAPRELTTINGIPATTVGRARRDCNQPHDHTTASPPRPAELIGREPQRSWPQMRVIDGKAMYDGRSLIAWASRVADRIVERCDVTRIVLYGSVACGDDGPDSDIDLLVIMPISGRRHDAAVGVLNELRDLPVPIDIVVVDPARVDEEALVPGVVRAALSEGRILAAA